MLTVKRTILGASVVLLLTAGLTGCAAVSADSTQVPSLVPAATAEDQATEAPVEAPAVVLDPVAQAAADSGLTAEVYAEVTAKAVALGFQIQDRTAFVSALESLSSEYGKPVVLIAHATCLNGSATEWGIAGALSGTAPPGCAQGYAESQETAVAKVSDWAGVKGWTASDYVVVFVDWVN